MPLLKSWYCFACSILLVLAYSSKAPPQSTADDTLVTVYLLVDKSPIAEAIVETGEGSPRDPIETDYTDRNGECDVKGKDLDSVRVYMFSVRRSGHRREFALGRAGRAQAIPLVKKFGPQVIEK